MNTRKLAAVSFLVAAVFALGCTADDGGLNELDENQALWESHGITDYTMDVDGWDGAPTVTALFGNVEVAIEQGVAIEVEYNDEFGFPEKLTEVEDADGLFDFEVTFIDFGVLEGPGGNVVVPPPPAPPRAPPTIPGFDKVVDDPIRDQPGAFEVFDASKGNLDHGPSFETFVAN